MTTGSLSVNEGSDTRLGGIVQSNWYFQFLANKQGQDVFSSPLAFPLPVSSVFAAYETSDSMQAYSDVLVSGEFGTYETGTDSFIASANVIVSGELAVSEAFADGLYAELSVAINGNFDGVDGSDTFSAVSQLQKPVGVGGGMRLRPIDDYIPYGNYYDPTIRTKKLRVQEEDFLAVFM